jgi:hypothetical protein
MKKKKKKTKNIPQLDNVIKTFTEEYKQSLIPSEKTITKTPIYKIIHGELKEVGIKIKKKGITRREQKLKKVIKKAAKKIVLKNQKKR